MNIRTWITLTGWACAAAAAHGWGGPHTAITGAALDALPAWQQETLGPERPLLASRYCLIPDRVYAKDDDARFAAMDSRPGVVYLVGLHLPASQPENFEVLRFFLGRAVDAFRAGSAKDGARYAGVLAHAVEDWCCPAHAVPGDNMFTLFQQFLPPPPDRQYTLLHGPVESGTLEVRIPGYTPRRLGDTVDEAAFHLLQRVHEGILNARAQVIPIIQGLYAGDTNAVAAAQLKAAVFDARIVADALHTTLCLAGQRPDPAAVPPPREVDLSALMPLDATNLAMPQASFHSKPYWGHPVSGKILREGVEPVPLKLRVGTAEGEAGVRTFASGIGAGTRSSLTYLLPDGLFQRFEVTAGLHADLGARGCVSFEILGNGARLAFTGALTGAAPARALSVPLAGITNLQLVAAGAGGDGLGNYAVWAGPRLIRADRPTPAAAAPSAAASPTP